MQARLSSLPTRGAWIEIGKAIAQGAMRIGRSPHGERGLKFKLTDTEYPNFNGRSPHGERGLKSSVKVELQCLGMVAPHTGSVD